MVGCKSARRLRSSSASSYKLLNLVRRLIFTTHRRRGSSVSIVTPSVQFLTGPDISLLANMVRPVLRLRLAMHLVSVTLIARAKA